MKNSMTRLAYLAEQRHIQYRNEYIEYKRNIIEENKKKMAEDSKKMSKLIEDHSKEQKIIDFGWKKIREQLKQEKEKKREMNLLKNQKLEALRSKARMEWLFEMNSKAGMWVRSPDELKYAQYRMLNKKIYERLPAKENYVLDKHPNPDFNDETFYEDENGVARPLDNDNAVAYLHSRLQTLQNNPSLEALNIDKDSQEYQEFLEWRALKQESNELPDEDDDEHFDDIDFDQVSFPTYPEDIRLKELALKNQRDN
eukprot:gene7412-9112_t